MNNIHVDNPEVVVVASCNVDLISYVKRFPFVGETIKGLKFETGFGGKGANKAVACSRLGSKVAVISMLGCDVFGQDYLKNFRDNNINIDRAFSTDKAPNGIAQVCVNERGDNTIVVILGANLLLSPLEIKLSEDLIKNAKFLVTNLEIPYETALQSLKMAKNNNVITVFNFSPVTPNYDEELWRNVDFLVVNEIELEELSKIEIKSVFFAKQACTFLINKLTSIGIGIICSMGANGVIFIDRKSKNIYHKQIEKKVLVVDSSGAGDAFVGTFVHYLNKWGLESVYRAIDLATDYASLTVQLLGVQSSYPNLSELDEKFKS